MKMVQKRIESRRLRRIEREKRRAEKDGKVLQTTNNEAVVPPPRARMTRRRGCGCGHKSASFAEAVAKDLAKKDSTNPASQPVKSQNFDKEVGKAIAEILFIRKKRRKIESDKTSSCRSCRTSSNDYTKQVIAEAEVRLAKFSPRVLRVANRSVRRQTPGREESAS